MLRDFRIVNFRGFKNLLLPQLGRVNLIIGKNSVGKSSVLEALRIYAANGIPEVLWDAVTGRDEHRQSKRTALGLISLFHDQPETKYFLEAGPSEDPLRLSIQFRRETTMDDGSIRYALLENPKIDDLIDTRIDLLVNSGSAQKALPFLRDLESYVGRSPIFRREEMSIRASSKMPSIFVSSNGIGQERQAELWDDIALSSLEEDLIASLRLVVPALERISLIGSKEERGRSPFVKLHGRESPIPLLRLGDGVNRIFGIVLALVNSQDGILLVDEIENGIHYSVQEDFWRFIVEVSRRLNVQVFATSHSWDCLKAFQRATFDCENEGVVTRLESREGGVGVAQFDESELEIASREQIEIR